MEKSEGIEHVSLENFVNKFELSHQESTTDAYQILISYHNIRKNRKQRLQEAFEIFRQHHEERFWAKLEVTVNSEVVANRALVSAQTFGQRQSKTILDQYISSSTNDIKTKSDLSGINSNSERKRKTDNSGSTTDQTMGRAHKESRRVSFGRSLTLADLSTNNNSAINGDERSERSLQSTFSPRSSLASHLISSDSGDLSFSTQESTQSSSRIFSWDFLDGGGWIDSKVDSHWVHKGISISTDLMKFRIRTVQDNGGLTEPHQKLAVNFIFLVGEEYQTDGLQGEVKDSTWEAMCDAIKDPIQPLSEDVSMEALKWFHRMANNKMESFEQMLEASLPSDPNLKSVLRNIASNTQYWSTQARNENTYLKALLGPLLEAYFGKIKYARSDWTPTQDDTRDAETSTLIPDYGTATSIGKEQYYALLLEGKIARNSGQHQMWDDLTKLGNEMKLALNSILKLSPSGEVCVVGILVREPYIEFFSMQICAEGTCTYIMHKFASAFIPSGASNPFPLLRLMEICEHAKKKVEWCIHQIRLVKFEESLNPKVDLSWLRPSFNKPKRYQVTDRA